MKASFNTKHVLGMITLGFFVVTGTYNAVVINSESSIVGQNVRLTKRLDEVYGIMKPGREVAASVRWEKLSQKQPQQIAVQANIMPQQVTQISSSHDESPQTQSQAAVQESLNLNLVEVINPKKWQQGLKSSQFNGSLATNNGIIESLSVSLPDGEGVSVSFSEMTGNVFDYDFNGEVYSGLLYQVDQNSYMVTLTNGPLEGTRLKFTGQPSEEVQAEAEMNQAEIATNNVEQTIQEDPQSQIYLNENQDNRDAELQANFAQEQVNPGLEQQENYNFNYEQSLN